MERECCGGGRGVVKSTKNRSEQKCSRVDYIDRYCLVLRLRCHAKDVFLHQEGEMNKNAIIITTCSTGTSIKKIIHVLVCGVKKK